MLNNIIEFSLKNRILILVISSIIMISGGMILQNMDVDVFPDLSAPTVTILTESHGMATEEVERLVSYPIESVLNGSPHVRRIRSSSARGISIVWVEFEWGTDIYRARQIVNEQLVTLRDRLPRDIGSPVLAPISSIMGEIMLISLSSDSIPPMELRTMADWEIRQRLLALQGVSQVVVIGGGYKQYQILASPFKMKYFGISLNEIEEAARSCNKNTSGGVLNSFGNQYVIRGEGKTISLEEIGNSLIKVVDGVPITIADVADVKIGTAPKIGDGSFMGKDAIILTVLKQPNANTIKLTEEIDKTLTEINKTLPEDCELNPNIFRQADFIQASIDNLKKTLLEGAFFVCIVLFLFLMNWRTTVISLTAIPLSLLVTVIVLKMMGLTINTMSLGGMAIAIGALVDDAIIDVENIYRRLRENFQLPEDQKKPVIDIVFEASKEIRNSILIATSIIVLSFIPLFLLSGMEGRLLQPLGISFIVALLTSLIVAVTVTPVMSSYLLVNSQQGKMIKSSFVERWIGGVYGKTLKRVLLFPKGVVGFTVILFLISLFLFTGLGRSFLPEFNEGSVMVSVVSAPGISLEESNNAGRRVERALMEMDEIEIVSRRTGRAELDEHAQGVNSSEIDAPFNLNGRSKESFLEEVRTKMAQIPGLNITLGQPIAHRIDHMLSGTKANIAIKVFGPDLNKLFSLGNTIKGSISGVQGLVDVNVEQQIEVPQIRIKPRRQMLARYGIRMSELMDFIDIGLAGESVSQVFEGNKSFDLVLRYEKKSRGNIEDIRNSQIDAIDGHKIPLHYVADISVDGSPYSISRENVQRKVVISANVSGRDLRGVVNEIQYRIKNDVDMAEGYRIEYGGQFENEAKASELLMWSSFGALFCIFFLLFLEFRDLKLAAVVLLNLPMALIGGIVIVYFSSGIISIASIIGFISLFGIATRNGILLVSRYQVLAQEGKGLYDTIIEGSLDRLNPILMTALTTGLALIPLALTGNKAGNEIQNPMAVVILGGLLTATLLNLIVIPVIYYLMNHKKSIQ